MDIEEVKSCIGESVIVKFPNVTCNNKLKEYDNLIIKSLSIFGDVLISAKNDPHKILFSTSPDNLELVNPYEYYQDCLKACEKFKNGYHTEVKEKNRWCSINSYTIYQLISLSEFRSTKFN